MSKSVAAEDYSSKSIFGFWVYLMTDCVIFATLFATYAVLRDNTYGRASGSQLFSLPFVLIETLVLLTSSFTCGLTMVAARARDITKTIIGLTTTFLLGIAFLAMELTEFSHLVHEGNSWRASAFLSSFFTLVGTHGLHIAVGLLWLVVLITVTLRRGLTKSVMRKLTMFSLFWHFLDIIWIFIFTIVYLIGVARL